MSTVSIILVLLLLFHTLSPTVKAASLEKVNSDDYSKANSGTLDSGLMSKDEMLSEAYAQLVEQNGERFYPIVKRMINYNKIWRIYEKGSMMKPI